MVMPIYEFECPKCKKSAETIYSLGEFAAIDEKKSIGVCKCGQKIYKKNQVINFAGYITMESPVTRVHKRYSNKGGGPKPIIDGKIRNDLKMPTQV